MCKWIYPESAQKLANGEMEQIQIFKTPDHPLYHYTSREVFWLIMEEESFLARHIMFSNDYEENMIGIEKIKQAMKDAGSYFAEPEALPFMICFCEDEDLLSQWRGYAKEGVAMEFDFSKGLYGVGEEERFSTYYCYTVMNQNPDTTKGENAAKYISKSTEGEDVIVNVIASPYSVIYTERGKQVDKEIIDNIEIIMKNTKKNRQQNVAAMIPYIKNNKFKEEKEYRLIFDMKQIIPETQQHLLQEKYKYLDVKGIKKPNIRVKFGDQSTAEKENIIKLYYADDNWTKILNELKQELSLKK